jgi:antitoxin VapB
MPLNIRNKEAERLASQVAKRTGESKTTAVINALRERLARLKRARPRRSVPGDLEEIASRLADLPVKDSRSTDEILGYDSHGFPR